MELCGWSIDLMCDEAIWVTILAHFIDIKICPYTGGSMPKAELTHYLWLCISYIFFFCTIWQTFRNDYSHVYIVTLECLLRIVESLTLYLKAIKLACQSFISGDRRHKCPEFETKGSFITHGTAKYVSWPLQVPLKWCEGRHK